MVTVSDEGESGSESDTEDHVAKKQRLDTSGRSGSDNDLQHIKSQVWEEIGRANGEAAVNDLLEGTDREQLAAALEALEEEGRIMSQDGIVYKVD